MEAGDGRWHVPKSTGFHGRQAPLQNPAEHLRHGHHTPLQVLFWTTRRAPAAPH